MSKAVELAKKASERSAALAAAEAVRPKSFRPRSR